MSPLVKTIIKSSAALAGTIVLYTGVKKIAPTILKVDPFSGNTPKTWIWTAGFFIAGTIFTGIIAKIFKITALKN
jgi:hypothetical protein